jgi:hypothetical protein
MLDARRGRKMPQMFAMSLPRKSSKGEVPARTEPSLLVRSADMLDNMLDARLRFRVDVECSNARSLIVGRAEGHDSTP